ncbi:MAG: hypothetical protein ACREU9_00050 [Gammaproteobacteria bacterium]
MSPYVGDPSGECLGRAIWWVGLQFFRPPADEKEPPPRLIREAIRAIEEYAENPDLIPMLAHRIGSKEIHHRHGRINCVKTMQAELYRMDALALVVGTPVTPERHEFSGRTVEHITKLSRIESRNDKLESKKRTVERHLQSVGRAGLLDSKRITDTTPEGKKVGRASIRWFAEQLFALLSLDKLLKGFRKFVSDSLKAVRYPTRRGKAIASLSLKVARAQIENKPKRIGDILKRGPP